MNFTYNLQVAIVYTSKLMTLMKVKPVIRNKSTNPKKPEKRQDKYHLALLLGAKNYSKLSSKGKCDKFFTNAKLYIFIGNSQRARIKDR